MELLGLAGGDERGGAVVLGPEVARDVVGLGRELVPALAVEAPAGVEQVEEPVAERAAQGVGQLGNGERAAGPVKELGQGHHVVGATGVAGRPDRLGGEAGDQVAALGERGQEALGGDVATLGELAQVAAGPGVAVLADPGAQGLGQLGPELDVLVAGLRGQRGQVAVDAEPEGHG